VLPVSVRAMPVPGAAALPARAIVADQTAGDVVHVSIGRVEVHAPAAPPPAVPPRPRPSPRLTLDDYLRERSRSRR
jgi:hypothetical protein